MNENEQMRRFSVRVTAKGINRRNMLLKIALIILLISVSILAVAYGLSMFVDKAGNFTVYVPEQGGSLSLSNTPDFAEPTVCIEADIIPEMTNIAKEWLPENIDGTDGNHNGENYIAHTFYLKNTGKEAVTYQADMDVLSSTLGADEAVRIMVIKNDQTAVYAKPKVGSEQPEENTVSFTTENKVFTQTNESFLPGAVDKYTVVIWLEGNDPECVDNIKGGVVKMSMSFKVIDGITLA